MTHMRSMLWEQWSIAGPWHLSALSGGKNNQTWRADAADGHSYVLRFITDPGQVPHMRYEATLLEALSSQQPPFLLPSPLRTHNGDVVVALENEDTTTFATLTPLLPGRVPADWGDLVLAAHAGDMLAWLDRALATLPDIPLTEDFRAPPLFGELAHWHPRVHDPIAAFERLPIAEDALQRIQAWLAAVIENVDALYKQLPRQLLHRDYDPGNILVDQQYVTAVLDFEFAGTDLRVLDLCIALSWWPIDFLGTGKEWQIIDAFGKAYVTHYPLSEQELLALPDVLRLRDATSLVYRVGRYLDSLETDERMQKRVQHSLWREDWLSTHENKLVEYALTWKNP